MMKQRNLKNLCDEAFGVSREAGSVKRKKTVIPAQAGIQQEADDRLKEIIARNADIEVLRAECEAGVQKVTAQFALRIEAREVLLKSAITALMQTMKFNKGILFDGTDVVNLPHGSLIHNVADKVSIPKTALAECEEQGFDAVIKIVNSLDRDAIEKWPDAKLILRGAERKQKEVVPYDLKN